jgi:hypothetical protein
MSSGLHVTQDPGVAWRVGFQPSPWVWTPPQFARFRGRWDDSERQFRTLYVGNSLYACLAEVLAPEHPDPTIEGELAEIEDPDDQAALHTEHPAGTIDYTWFDRRLCGQAQLRGQYCYVTHSATVAAIRAYFDLTRFGIDPDEFDVSYLKDKARRPFTRALARWLYGLASDGGSLVDGVEFRSRHGDELSLWAIFERPQDPDLSPLLEDTTDFEIGPDHDEIVAAMRLHGLRWVD